MLDRQVSGNRWRAGPRLWAALVLPIALICWGQETAAQTTGSVEDPRATAFLESLKALEETSKQSSLRIRYLSDVWLSSKSPWAPYLAKPFTAGLSEADRVRELAAQERGDCRTVLRLQKRGFLSLYPFLRLALERNGLAKTTFIMTVAPRHEPGLARCTAYRRLNYARAELARRWKAPYTVDSTQLIGPSVLYEFDDPAQAQWCQGVRTLYDLAISRDFKAAQRDLLALMAEPTRLILQLTAEYYVLERARRRGLVVRDAAERYAHIRQILRPAVQKRIERAAKVGDAEMAKLPRWRCPGLPPDVP